MSDTDLRDRAIAELQLTTVGWRKPNGQPQFPSGTAPMTSHWGKAMALLNQIGAEPPPPPPPTGLPFSEATVTNAVVVTTPSTTLNFETGKDYDVDFSMQTIQSLQLNGSPRNVRIRNLRTRDGIKVYATATGHISITNWFVEGSPSTGDILAIACKPQTKLTVQRFLWETPKDSNNQSGHLDLVQVQGAIGRLELGLGTGYITGVRPPNQGGKAMQLDILNALGETGAPFSVDMRNVDFEAQSTPSTGARSGPVIIGKDDNASIQMSLSGVYVSAAPVFDSILTNYPSPLQKSVSGSSPNRVISLAGNTQGWTGEAREAPTSAPKFVTRALLGL